MMSALKTDLQQAQKDVQRKLGRCMLRLQQYERLLKAMLASMNLKGPAEDLLTARERRTADMRKKTLGTLVKQFTGEHLCAALVTQMNDQEDEAEPTPVLVPIVEISYSFSLSPEAYEEATASLAELVYLRNELVHHLIERFDVSNENECHDASLYLDRCYRRIESGCQQLKAWAMAIDEVRTKTSSFVQSQMYESAFAHGINPDGTVSWQISSIVVAEFLLRSDGIFSWNFSDSVSAMRVMETMLLAIVSGWDKSRLEELLSLCNQRLKADTLGGLEMPLALARLVELSKCARV